MNKDVPLLKKITLLLLGYTVACQVIQNGCQQKGIISSVTGLFILFALILPSKSSSDGGYNVIHRVSRDFISTLQDLTPEVISG
jgi:hypothetical protein